MVFIVKRVTGDTITVSLIWGAECDHRLRQCAILSSSHRSIQSTLRHLKFALEAIMATQQVQGVQQPNPMRLGSPYCCDPTCRSCEALRDEYGRLKRNEAPEQHLVVVGYCSAEEDKDDNDSAFAYIPEEASMLSQIRELVRRATRSRVLLPMDVVAQIDELLERSSGPH